MSSFTDHQGPSLPRIIQANTTTLLSVSTTFTPQQEVLSPLSSNIFIWKMTRIPSQYALVTFCLKVGLDRNSSYITFLKRNFLQNSNLNWYLLESNIVYFYYYYYTNV